jgi:hypothetical protein
MDHQAFAQLLGSYGEFVGAIAVVATLVYVAGQLRQNTNAVRSASYQAFNEISFSWADSFIENAGMVAKIESYTSWDELSPEELVFWRALTFKSFTVMESNFLHHRAGTMDDDVFEARMSPSVVLLNEPIWRESFTKAHMFLLPEFKDFMEARIGAAQ